LSGKLKTSSNLSRHDADLVRSKEENKRIRLVLACDTYYTDEDASLLARVEYVDRYAVKIAALGAHKGLIWITKQAIVSTEVLA
jgi:hypothetical protein